MRLAHHIAQEVKAVVSVPVCAGLHIAHHARALGGVMRGPCPGQEWQNHRLVGLGSDL